jgi:hypothetical protein
MTAPRDMARSRAARRVSVAGLILLSAMLTGCMSEHSFVVVNDSGAPVVVEYAFAPLPASDAAAPPRYAFAGPLTRPRGLLSEWTAEWEPVPGDRAVVDRERGTVRVELAPDRLLRVAYAFDYSGEASWKLQVNIARMTITGPAGALELAGDEVRQRFVESDGAYVLVYR